MGWRAKRLVKDLWFEVRFAYGYHVRKKYS